MVKLGSSWYARGFWEIPVNHIVETAPGIFTWKVPALFSLTAILVSYY